MSATIDSFRSDPQQFQAYEPRAPLEDLRPGAFAVGGPGGARRWWWHYIQYFNSRHYYSRCCY